MMAPQQQNRWRVQRGLSALLAICCLCFPVHLLAALTVQVLGAPEPALRALRAAAPDIRWLNEVTDSSEAAVTLYWHADSDRARPAAGTGSRPRLVLAQTAHDGPLRQEDSALYWGVNLVSQWRLARDMVPGLQRVGVFYPPEHAQEVAELRREAGEERVVARLLTRSPTARDVAELAQRADALLGVSDATFFSRETAKVILLSSYRHQRPWIGPTPAFVAAGAVATAAVPKSVLIEAIITQFRHWERTGSFPPARVLEPSEVICNVQVARSLGLDISRVPCVPVRGGS